MVPGIVARDESSGNFLRIFRFITSNFDTRSQTDAPINLHAAIGRDSDSLTEFLGITAFFASRILGVYVAEHLADYRRKRFLMASRCRKEEIGMTAVAKHLRIVCISILILTTTTT